MGEILQDDKLFFLQWCDDHSYRWRTSVCFSLGHAKQEMADMKALNKEDGVKLKYRIVEETTKREVVYDE